MVTPDAEIPQAECDDRETIAAGQARRLQQLLAAIAGRNRFYTRKLEQAGVGPDAAAWRLPGDLAR